jgi:sensor histidine kinase YesM
MRWMRDAVQVPPMLLQPFVENALKHGLKGKSAKGSINIHVGIEGHELKCTIEDDGVGRSDTLAHVREGHTSLGNPHHG